MPILHRTPWSLFHQQFPYHPLKSFTPEQLDLLKNPIHQKFLTDLGKERLQQSGPLNLSPHDRQQANLLLPLHWTQDQFMKGPHSFKHLATKHHYQNNTFFPHGHKTLLPYLMTHAFLSGSRHPHPTGFNVDVHLPDTMHHSWTQFGSSAQSPYIDWERVKKLPFPYKGYLENLHKAGNANLAGIHYDPQGTVQGITKHIRLGTELTNSLKAHTLHPAFFDHPLAIPEPPPPPLPPKYRESPITR